MRRVSPFALLILLLILSGCARWSERATKTPDESLRIYPELPVLPMPDLSPLAGRRICVDPGHGGPWTGAVTPSNDLRESDVNLRVALRLKQLLAQAGARALLTRQGDYALYPGNLAADLAARADLAGRARAELFLSIHHNADIVEGSAKNDLEVYYKLGDDGASLDIAQCLTYAVARRLRPDAAAKRLLPANYKVLRLAYVPAVLLESSYMTHPKNAGFLSTDRAVEAEAQAIAAGLASYFALDPPLVDRSEVVARDQGRTHQLLVHFARGYPVDGKSIQVRLNGQHVDGEYDFLPATLIWVFRDPLPNGAHRIALRVRNFLGAAVTHTAQIRVNRPAHTLAATQRPPSAPRGSGIEVLFEIRVHDALGLPVADGTQVQACELAQVAQTRKGLARFYVAEEALPESLTFHSGDQFITAHRRSGGEAYNTMRVVDALTRQPVSGALVMADGQPVGVTTEEGWCAVPAEASRVALSRRGYEPTQADLTASHGNLPLEPVEQGLLHGRRIVLDPAHGGREAGAVGPSGTRSSDVSLEVAQRAAAYLRTAGARVFLTRSGDTESSELQRVRLAEGHRPEIYITISFGSPRRTAKVLGPDQYLGTGVSSYVGHYPNSGQGNRLANTITEAMGISTVSPAVAYVMQHTSCPAVWVQPAHIIDLETERVYRSMDARQRAAYMLYTGILDYFRTLDLTN